MSLILKKVAFNNHKIHRDRSSMESFEMGDSNDLFTFSFFYCRKDTKTYVKHDFFRKADSQDVKQHHPLTQLHIDILILDFES